LLQRLQLGRLRNNVTWKTVSFTGSSAGARYDDDRGQGDVFKCSVYLRSSSEGSFENESTPDSRAPGRTLRSWAASSQAVCRGANERTAGKGRWHPQDRSDARGWHQRCAKGRFRGDLVQNVRIGTEDTRRRGDRGHPGLTLQVTSTDAHGHCKDHALDRDFNSRGSYPPH
jgi:hypothetical protein